MARLPNPQSTQQGASPRKLLIAVGIGNALEWFDFSIYGLFAPQIAANFFPGKAPLTGLLATFAVLAVAFLARPFGGILFGVIGDRKGRRYALSLAVVLMGAGTAAIGVLPTHAQVGVLAPVLLICCRIVQGVSAGGEYNSATAFVTEHAPSDRRGKHASIISATVALSTVLGTAMSLFVLGWLSASQIQHFGWRVPFIVVGLLSVLGLYLRLRMEETPVYREFQAKQERGGEQEQQVVKTIPVRKALRTHTRVLVTIFCAAGVVGLVTYIFLGYLVSHLQVKLDYSPRQALAALMIGATAQLIALVVFGRVIDAVNRRRWFLVAAGVAVLAPLPLYQLLPSGYAAVVCVMCVLGTLVAALSVCYNLLTVEMLPTSIRVTGGAVAYNVAYVVFGGTAPFVATWVTKVFGSSLAPALYMVGVTAVLTLVLVCTLPDTSNVGSLDELDNLDVAERVTG
ncbi:MFS transporter [Amycolatopsis sp. RM579]|uniref:MFS transporter n=1 Tax=Amycolatopsis pithecellobii TaxID=664692 RepID=A0A6N7YRE5_9PSEU|nr:MFS transporter [Amycolatopsis pithecellobii]